MIAVLIVGQSIDMPFVSLLYHLNDDRATETHGLPIEKKNLSSCLTETIDL